MERRGLVGRRYEDFLRNQIHFDLTPEEYAWRWGVADPRYAPQLERRKRSRRLTEAAFPNLPEVFLSSDGLLRRFLK